MPRWASIRASRRFFFVEGRTESLRFSAYVSRNAYLASYGVIFDDPLLQFWFESCSWYEPVIPESEFDYSVMSDIELSNIEQADALLAELG